MMRLSRRSTLLVGERERRLDDRLLAQLLDLERRAKRDAAEHEHRDDDGRDERKVRCRSAFRSPPATGALPLAHGSNVTRGSMRSGSSTTPRVARNSANCSPMYVSAWPSPSLKEPAVTGIGQLEKPEESPPLFDGRASQRLGTTSSKAQRPGWCAGSAVRVGDDHGAPLAHGLGDERVFFAGANVKRLWPPLPDARTTTNSRASMS